MGISLKLIETYAGTTFLVLLGVAALLTIAAVMITIEQYTAGRKATADQANVDRLQNHFRRVKWLSWAAANTAAVAFVVMAVARFYGGD